MIKYIKSIHTFVWIIMASANFLAFYLAFIGNFGAWFWAALVLLSAEIIVITANKWKCPITGWAEKHTSSRHPNFDIYLPEWLAKYNMRIFSVLIIIEIIVILFKSV